MSTDTQRAAMQAARDLLADMPIPDGYYSASNEVIGLLDAALKQQAEPIRCKEKLKPGGCQLHNLHCGWPKCNEAPAQPQQAELVAQLMDCSQAGAKWKDAWPEKQAEPTCWALTETLDARLTTSRACLWFVNPQNTAWEPLYRAAPPQPQQAEPSNDAQDAARWRAFRAAGGDLTLRLHNTRGDFRDAVIDAALGKP